MADGTNPVRQTKWHRRGRWIAAVALLTIVVAAVVGIALYRAEPVLRSTVIQTLSTRFKSKVELDAFHVSLSRGLLVSGKALRIFGDTDPNNHEPGVQPIIEIGEFRFRMKLAEFLRSPMRVDTVYVSGLRLNLPPREDRAQMQRMGAQDGKIKIVVGTYIFEDAQLIINTLRPGKLPIEFNIASLKMTRTGANAPLRFEAELTNPKPTGTIFTSGYFGPWQADTPRETPLSGGYSFTHADLSTIKGLGGILSSKGKFDGTLEKIAVDGSTDTPDFQLAICRRPIPLHTDFHAIVDGTSGDTYLRPVRAKILNSWLTAKGSVVRQKNPRGHRVKLEVTIEKAQIDDLLKLAVRSDPPMLSGSVQMKTNFDLAPGEDDVADRLKLAGDFVVSGADFSDEQVQNKINSLSLRSRGKPKLARGIVSGSARSDLNGTFDLADGVISFSQLQFRFPGTVVALTGKYSMDGSDFDFRGTARMDATLSHMVTGWKALLLKPVDPFFSKNGAGTEVPVRVSGTKSAPHFALDFGHKVDNRVDNKEENRGVQTAHTN
jgi:AsmA-like C-terminal region